MNNTAAVLGPGAVGGSLAVRLANAGVQVICVAHPEAAGLIALAGLVVESPEGTLTARVEVVEQLAKPVDLLLVTVKAPGLDDAIERVDPSAVARGVVVPLLNGLEHMDVLRGTLRRTRRGGQHLPLPGLPGRSGSDRRGDARSRDHDRVREPHRHRGRAGRRHAPTRAHRRAGRPEREARAVAQARAHRSARGGDVGVGSRRSASCGPTRSGARSSTPRIVEACAVAEADGVSLRPAAQWAIIEEMADETTTSAARDVAAGRRSELDAILGRRAARGRAPRRPVPDADRARRRSRPSVSTPSAVAFVPARSGSERVPQQERPPARRPSAARLCDRDRAPERLLRARRRLHRLGGDRRRRALVRRRRARSCGPPEYATSTSPDIEWLAYTLEHLDERYDLFALIRATNPFRGPDVVRRGLEQLLAHARGRLDPRRRAREAAPREDVAPRRRRPHDDARCSTSPTSRSRGTPASTRRCREVYVQNSALEIAWTRVVTETGTREGEVLAPFLTRGLEGFNVDDEEDWERAERLVAAGEATLPEVGRPPYPPAS